MIMINISHGSCQENQIQLKYVEQDFPCTMKRFVPKSLEVVSKPQIRFNGKAQADRESAAYMGM